MFVYVDDTLQLGLDCVTQITPRLAIAYGWAMTPRDEATSIAISAGAEGDCAIEHVAFHARPDVVPPDPRRAVVNGFSLLFDTPEDARELTFTLTAGEALVRADLRDPSIESNLFKATAQRDWRATFGLLQDCAGNPALAPLLAYQGRPFGAFADWIVKLPAVQGRAENFGPLAEVEALASSAGEVVVMLRGALAMPREAGLAAMLIGHVQQEPGAPAELVALPLADLHTARLPAALALYGRIDVAWLDRLVGLELVVRGDLRADEQVWIRCQPRAAALPEFLDATCRAAPSASLGVGAAALDLLRQVIARREAAFAPTIAALGAAAPPGAGPGAPRMALILGADDRTASRLFHVTAHEFEQRCDSVLVLGEAADEVAQVFARRGRVEVTVGQEAAQALRDAAGQAGVLAIDATRYAEAVTAGRPQDAFASPLGAAEVARLLTLHAVAGCGTTLADSLARLLKLRHGEGAGGEGSFSPVPRIWSNGHAGDLVNAHLARLWTSGQAPARAAEGALHV